MKLRQLIENEYEGLEDADEFSDGTHPNWAWLEGLNPTTPMVFISDGVNGDKILFGTQKALNFLDHLGKATTKQGQPAASLDVTDVGEFLAYAEPEAFEGGFPEILQIDLQDIIP